MLESTVLETYLTEFNPMSSYLKNKPQSQPFSFYGLGLGISLEEIFYCSEGF